jgi:hypothetical protein
MFLIAMVTIFGSTVITRTDISSFWHLKESVLKKFFHGVFERNYTKEVLSAISGWRPRLKIFLVVIHFLFYFSRVPPTQREKTGSGGRSGAQRGTRCACEAGAGCAGIHPDARSNGRSVEGGVHVRVRARRVEAGYASIRTHTPRRLGAGHAE